MKEVVIGIRDLVCAYVPGRTVLKVEDLRIHRGELLFLLGRSGIGKSTFLELAGLMNRPAGGVSGEVLFHDRDGRRHALLDLWDQTNQAISDFRNRYLAFIFQETNLLDQFSAGENMVLPALIQGQARSAAEERVRALMAALSLDPSLAQHAPAHLSGGQKQRMAFIRALATDFEVLFGDEPTGNLDPVTARRLMEVLREHLHRYRGSGIVVSHDISLALGFADRIAVVTESADTPGQGVLLPEHLFRRSGPDWQAGQRQYAGEAMPDLLSSLIRATAQPALSL